MPDPKSFGGVVDMPSPRSLLGGGHPWSQIPSRGGGGGMCMTDTTPGRYTPRKVPLQGEDTPQY